MTQKRIYIKLGDIFSVEIDGSMVKYFQYVANDRTQLNSSVIRVFKQAFDADHVPNFDEIIKGEVEFAAHVFLRNGVKLGYWKKAGKASEIGKMDVLFRHTMDYGRKLGEPAIEVSENWYVWKTNEPTRRVGKLKGAERTAEIGMVIAPDSLVFRIKHSSYDFPYYPKINPE